MPEAICCYITRFTLFTYRNIDHWCRLFVVICIVNPWRVCTARVTVVGSLCVCVGGGGVGVCVWVGGWVGGSVKSHLTSGASVRPENTVTYSAGNGNLLQRYTASCVVGYCSDVLRTFSTAEPSKGPKKANNRLNSTWNMTRRKAPSFFVFSLRLLPKVFHILPVNAIRMVIDLACVLSRIRAHAYAEGSAL